MKKILHISKYYYPFIGGTEQVARDIVMELKKKDGIEQKVIAFNEDIKDGEIIYNQKETKSDYIDGIEVIRCGYVAKVSSQAISISYKRELSRILKEFKPDSIVFHYPNPFVAALLLPRLNANIELILYWHLDITRQKILGKLIHKQNLKLLKRANTIVSTSPNYVEDSPYLTRFKEKIVVIPNCVQINRLLVTEKINLLASKIKEKYKNKTICLAVGRHVEYKGYEFLIKSAKELDDTFSVLIGSSGPLTKKLKEDAKNCTNIEFLGRLTDEELMAYYIASDIFCFPSITKNEAFGIALAEGMFFSKPAVTYTIHGSGVNYVNLDGVTGLECPNRDTRAYAKALEKLSKDEELRTRLGVKARERVLEKFTDEQFGINISNLFNKE